MRLDRCPKLVFGGAAPLVGVGMVHFEPFLVATPDFLRCRLQRKTECLESLGFEHFEFSSLEQAGRLCRVLCGGSAGF